MRRARLTQQLRFSYFESVDSSFLKEANIKAVLKKRRGQLVLYFLCYFLFRLCRFRRKVSGMEIRSPGKKEFTFDIIIRRRELDLKSSTSLRLCAAASIIFAASGLCDKPRRQTCGLSIVYLHLPLPSFIPAAHK